MRDLIGVVILCVMFFGLLLFLPDDNQCNGIREEVQENNRLIREFINVITLGE